MNINKNVMYFLIFIFCICIFNKIYDLELFNSDIITNQNNRVFSPQGLDTISAWYDPNTINLQNFEWKNMISNKLHLTSNSNIKVEDYNNNKVIKFTTNSSFIMTNDKDSTINGFMAVVCVDNTNSFNMLYCLYGNNDDNSFRSINRKTNINNNDIQYGNGGIVAYNGTNIYQNNTYEPSIINTHNTYVIVYVKFSDRYKNDSKISVTLGSKFMNRGFKGTIGDVIIFNDQHTDVDRRLMEGYLATKWNIKNSLTNHAFNPSSTMTGFGHISITNMTHINITPKMIVYGSNGKGIFVLTNPREVSICLIGGGGGGGGGNLSGNSAPGGGGGGAVMYHKQILQQGVYFVIVGKGGNGGSLTFSGNNGSITGLYHIINNLITPIIFAHGGAGGRSTTGDGGSSGGIGGASVECIINGISSKSGKGGNGYQSIDPSTIGPPISLPKNSNNNTIFYESITVSTGGEGGESNSGGTAKRFDKASNSLVNASGQDATIYGCGGGGCTGDCRNPSLSGLKGGNGADGLCIVWF